MKRQKSLILCFCLVLVVGLTLAPLAAGAADKYFVGFPAEPYWWNDSFWSTSLDGPGGAGVPKEGDNVFIIQTQAPPVWFTLPYIDPPASYTGGNIIFPIQLGTITIDNTCGTTTTLQQTSTYYALQSQELRVGVQGSARVIQYSGLDQVKGDLYLGWSYGSNGYYFMGSSGGSIPYLEAARENIGVSGQGTIEQDNGTNHVGQYLRLGQNASGEGSYILRGGSLKVDNVLGFVLRGIWVGWEGKGTFDQFGGTTETPILALGNTNTSNGTYNLWLGSLNTFATRIGGDPSPQGGWGHFFNNAGSHTTEILYLRYGSYELNGSLTVNQDLFIGAEVNTQAVFTQYSGNNVTKNLSIGGQPGLVGYKLEGGILTTTKVMIGCDSVAGFGTVSGNGSFGQSGGTHTVLSDLTLGYSSNRWGGYVLDKGDLIAVAEVIGKPGSGLFQQNGGTNTVNYLLDIGSQGDYELAGGDLKVAKMNQDPGGKFNKTGSNFQAGDVTNAGSMILAGTGTALVTGTTQNLPGGLIQINGNPATFGGPVTNQGTFQVTNTTVTFAGEYIEQGSLINQGGNLLFSNLTVDRTGVLQATPTSRWFFTHDLEILSTRGSEWNTAGADLFFISPPSPNGDVNTPIPTTHVLKVTGQDLGPTTNGLQGNFGWARLILGDKQSVFLKDGDDTPGGALYVGEIIGLQFDAGHHYITNLLSNGINLYYDPLDPANDYLDGQQFFLAGGGGLLSPAVPIPPTWLLLGSGLLGLGAVGWRGRRRQ